VGSQDDTAQHGTETRKRRSGRLLSFIVQNGEKISLVQVTTEAFSISLAWKELVAAGKVNEETHNLLGVVKGHQELIAKDELKKPTYKQLADMVKKMNA